VGRIAMALTVVSAFVLSLSHEAFAQNPVLGRYNGNKGVARISMRGAAKRGAEQVGRYGSEYAIGQKFLLPPLPGEQGFADSSAEPGEYLPEKTSEIPDFGLNSRESDNISLPPLRGLRQILDSDVTKDLLKELTQAKANVLMQTYMMVENGAATGFMGGMNIGSNLMSNMLEAQDAQMRMMDVVDDTGQTKEAYVRRIAHLLREGDNKNIWPAAIYMASGENGKKPPQEPEMKDLKDGSKPYDFQHLPQAGNSKDPNIRILSELIFNPGNASGSTATSTPYKNDKIQINALKEEFVKLVGDMKLEIKKPEDLSRKIEYTYIAPEEGATDTQKRRGIANVNWEEVVVVWSSINNILGDVCEWKKAKKNAGKEIFQKETLATSTDIGKNKDFGDPWELASSPDFPLTLNVVEQLWKYIERNEDTSKLDCGRDIKLGEDGIPTKGQASGTNLNDCSDKNGCVRKRVILHLSYLMARSRTLHTYNNLFFISKKFSTDPMLNGLVDDVFKRALAGLDVGAELNNNRERYADFIDYLGKLSKGDVGAGNGLRPGSNNVSEAQVVGVQK
jgi:hypothetical protein